MVQDIFLFATLRFGGLRHYYQPNVASIVDLLDRTYQMILDELNPIRQEMIIEFAYEVGKAEAIPLILRQKGKIPNSWRKIVSLYKKHFPKLLKKRG